MRCAAASGSAVLVRTSRAAEAPDVNRKGQQPPPMRGNVSSPRLQSKTSLHGSSPFPSSRVMGRRLALLLALGACASAGGLKRVELKPRSLEGRGTVDIFSHGEHLTWFAVVITNDSVTGVPSTARNLSRTGLALADVDSILVRPQGRGLWRPDPESIVFVAALLACYFFCRER